jgi:hypothetical protein
LESKDIYYSLPQSISPSSKFDNWTRNQKYSVLGKPKYTETLGPGTYHVQAIVAMLEIFYRSVMLTLIQDHVLT